MSELYAHEYGRRHGAPTVALHGVSGHGARFRRLAAEGLPERRWICPDLRGHGRSTPMPPWRLETWAADVLETMDAHGLERVDLIGHSLGGNVATHVAALAPDRVARLVLLDPAIGLAPRDGLETAESWRAEGRHPWPSRAAYVAEKRADRPEYAWPAVDEEADAHLVRGDDGRFGLRITPTAVIAAWGEMTRPPVSLAAYPSPVLLVDAAQEDYVNDELRASLRADLGSRLTETTIATSHMLYWDAFDETVAAVRGALDPP